MAQRLKLLIKGLYLHPNPLSEVPEGALSVANNGVIDRESIFETRRGYKQYGDPLSDLKQLLVFSDTLLAHDGSTLYYDADDLGTWTALAGTITEPCPPIKLRGTEQNQNFYFTSQDGIKKLADPAGPISQAGMPAALDTEAAVSGASGFLADDSAVAYRIVWAERDINNVLILGAPSARTIVRNTAGGTRNVDLTFTLPADIVAGNFYQVYRSEQTLAATDTPSDDLQLVIEREVVAGDVTAGTISITDSIPDNLKGPFIYTASTQEGILQANFRPPLACDLTRFRQHMFYARTTRPHEATMVVDAQVALDETVTIAGVTYTQKAAEDVANDEFALGSTITDTMRSLIRVINRSTSNTTVYAYEISENSFRIEERDLPGSGFTADASDAALFVNTLPVSSTQEDRKNRVYISKLQQPESVPLLNFLDIGSGDKAILRIIDVQDAVFVLKEDGIYRITGTDTTNFIAEQHDSTITIIGPNTAREFNNRVFAMSNQGVIAISVTGVAIVSRPIERTLLRLSEFDNFETTAWAVDYESDRKFILAAPTTDIDTEATQLFVYNTITQSWTRWLFAATAAQVSTRDDRLYIARVTDNQVLQERKTFTLDDYADDEYAVSITGFTDTTVDIAAVPTGVVEGMTLRQGTTQAVITEIDGLTLTVDPEQQPWTVAAATIFTPIPTEIEFVEEHARNPGVLKHWPELTYIFEDARFREITARFSTNFLAGFKSLPLSAQGIGAWGQFTWGDVEWGGGLGGFQTIRTYFPKEATRAHWVNLRLELNQAFTAFSLAGVSIIANPMDTKFK